MKLKIGDHVRWITDIYGITIKRNGIVVYILEPFVSLCEVIYDKEFISNTGKNVNFIYNNINDFNTFKSYLIMSGRKEGQIPNIHWPDVNILKKIRRRKFKKIIKDKE
jgi:hypothetical protein